MDLDSPAPSPGSGHYRNRCVIVYNLQEFGIGAAIRKEAEYDEYL
jgi:hypothetical protein